VGRESADGIEAGSRRGRGGFEAARAHTERVRPARAGVAHEPARGAIIAGVVRKEGDLGLYKDGKSLQSLLEILLLSSQFTKSWAFSTLSAGRTILQHRPDFQNLPQ
jgi:hypothetical protein